jgi:hypothetical protein
MSDVIAESRTKPRAVVRQARPLLTVSQLREQLERIERAGGGHWEVDVVPETSIAATSTGRDDVDFDLLSYGITRTNALGDGSENFVALMFAPAPLPH